MKKISISILLFSLFCVPVEATKPYKIKIFKESSDYIIFNQSRSFNKFKIEKYKETLKKISLLSSNHCKKFQKKAYIFWSGKLNDVDNNPTTHVKHRVFCLTNPEEILNKYQKNIKDFSSQIKGNITHYYDMSKYSNMRVDTNKIVKLKNNKIENQTQVSVYKNSTCISGKCVYGKGVMKFTDGSVYDGEFDHVGYFDGYGEYTWADGKKYEGEWSEGKYDGYGVYTWPEGDKYEGEWSKGEYHKGTLTYKNGKKDEGTWEQGRFFRTGNEKIKIKPNSTSIVIPVSVHLVLLEESLKKNSSHSKEERFQFIENDFNYANLIWQQANLYFDVVEIYSFEPEIPKNFYKETRWIEKNMKGVDQKNIKRYEKFIRKLLDVNKKNKPNSINIYYLPTQFRTTARGKIAGEFFYKSSKKYLKSDFATINYAGISDLALAHELGHVFRLGHIKSDINIMHGKQYGGNEIENDQIQIIKKNSTIIIKKLIKK